VSHPIAHVLADSVKLSSATPKLRSETAVPRSTMEAEHLHAESGLRTSRRTDAHHIEVASRMGTPESVSLHRIVY
jgi:hypothetical protein